MMNIDFFLLAICVYIPLQSHGDVIIDYSTLRGTPYTAHVDSRSLVLNGKRAILISGSMHYVRSKPKMWPSIFRKAKLHGLNTISSYVMWNVHEPDLNHTGDKAIYIGGYNVTHFLDEASKAGLFVIWRIGPFVAGEWPAGGIPDWVKDLPGMKIRSYNKIWLNTAYGFVSRHLRIIEPYLARHGGPIVMIQIENELHVNDLNYTAWIGDWVDSHDVGIPWIMCENHNPIDGKIKGDYANNTIATCNGCACGDEGGWLDQHAIAQPNMPHWWTENEMWFDVFRDAQKERPILPLAFDIALWFARGGSMHNYYMWFGGNMYGNYSHPLGLPFGLWHTPRYANTAPLHSDGTRNEPKWSHLGRFHCLMLKYAETILKPDTGVKADAVMVWNRVAKHWQNSTCSNPNNPATCKQRAYVYKHNEFTISFIANNVNDTFAVLCRGVNVTILPLSITLLDQTHANVLWSSANVTNDGIYPLPYTRIIYPSNIVPLDWTSWIDKSQGGWWFQTSFPTPDQEILPKDAPLLVNLTGMYIGNVFFNGYHAATYAMIPGNCSKQDVGPCNGYKPGTCGKPTQDVYEIPQDWFTEVGPNQLMVFVCASWSNGNCHFFGNETAPLPSQIRIQTSIDTVKPLCK